MSLRASYTVLAPFYDALIAGPTAAARSRSLARLRDAPKQEVFISGVGTGLDLKFAPTQHRYTGLDITRAMLAKIPARDNLALVEGDSQRLPFAANVFDHAVLHLILAVVPDGGNCLAETARVVKPGGSILVLDKFLRRGKLAPLRRLLTPFFGQIATRLDVVFEDLLASAPSLSVASDEPAFFGGWFRLIQLVKTTT